MCQAARFTAHIAAWMGPYSPLVYSVRGARFLSRTLQGRRRAPAYKPDHSKTFEQRSEAAKKRTAELEEKVAELH